MPLHRDVYLTLVSTGGQYVVPEFAPPEEPQYDSFGRPKIGPIVTVFAPIVPSSQLWVTYALDPHPAFRRHAHYLFRLFLDGRHVANWDCGVADGHRGKMAFTIVRDRSDGKLTRQVLCFADPPDDDTKERKSNGDDAVAKSPDANNENIEAGCVLEIRVHRVKARRRAQPHDGVVSLPEDDHSSSAKNGGSSKVPLQLLPAGHLGTQDRARFYTYALQDPLDTPNSTVRYEFRTAAMIARLSLTPLPPALLTLGPHRPSFSSSVTSSSTCTPPSTSTSSSSSSRNPVRTAATVSLVRASPSPTRVSARGANSSGPQTSPSTPTTPSRGRPATPFGLSSSPQRGRPSTPFSFRSSSPPRGAWPAMPFSAASPSPSSSPSSTVRPKLTLRIPSGGRAVVEAPSPPVHRPSLVVPPRGASRNCPTLDPRSLPPLPFLPPAPPRMRGAAADEAAMTGSPTKKLAPMPPPPRLVPGTVEWMASMRRRTDSPTKWPPRGASAGSAPSSLPERGSSVRDGLMWTVDADLVAGSNSPQSSRAPTPSPGTSTSGSRSASRASESVGSPGKQGGRLKAASSLEFLRRTFQRRKN